MKLKEIMHNLHEAFDYRPKVIWSSVRGSYHTKFEIDERVYTLKMEYTDFTELLGDDKKGYEISFTGKNTASTSASTFHAPGNNSAKHAIRVFSAVINSVESKLKELDSVDLIYFTAKNNDDSFESRVSLYDRLSSSLSKRLNLELLNKHFPNFELYILSTQHIESEIVDYIVGLITEH
jgi:hypothetical protein